MFDESRLVKRKCVNAERLTKTLFYAIMPCPRSEICVADRTSNGAAMNSDRITQFLENEAEGARRIGKKIAWCVNLIRDTTMDEWALLLTLFFLGSAIFIGLTGILGAPILGLDPWPNAWGYAYPGLWLTGLLESMAMMLLMIGIQNRLRGFTWCGDFITIPKNRPKP